MRAHLASPRAFAARLIALLCVAFVPIAVGAAIGTPAAVASSSGHDDTVFAFGSAAFHGSTSGFPLAAPIVAMASTVDGRGYWIVANDGGVFGFNAPFYGSLGATHLNAPIIGMAATPTGHGYWLVASDGGVFSFGDAHFFGSTGGVHLNAPVTQLIPGPGGGGYWLMARDGGVFTFGSERFYGSMGGTRLNAPILGMTSTPRGRGYLLVASDGGVFTFGDAHFRGSAGGSHLTSPVIGIAGDSTGLGYWLASQDGNVLNYGDAKEAGNARTTLPSTREVVQITGAATTGGYRLLALPKPPVPVLATSVGATGAKVSAIQSRLLELGFWLPGVSGTFDSNTQQAVYAFQKYNGLARNGVVDFTTQNALNAARRPVPRSTSGYVIEIDKTRQVLIVANNGTAQWVFNTSSGSDHAYTSEGVRYSAHTPEGMFKFSHQVDGFDKSPLGVLYRPKYFTWTGIAVHGYTSVPPFPASHGCVRVPNAAIDYIWANNIMPIGSSVWVYV